MKRGEIYYIEKASTTGSEQAAGRPAIIVSNDRCNFHSEVVEIVYLTTSPKTDLPTHVTIRSATRVSIALCEQVTSVSVSRIGAYISTCTDAEMDAIDHALAISLDIPEWEPQQREPEVKSDTVSAIVQFDLEDMRMKLAEAFKERDLYRELYEKLVDKLISR